MIGFIIGLVVGALIGFVVSALCAANSCFEDGDIVIYLLQNTKENTH